MTKVQFVSFLIIAGSILTTASIANAETGRYTMTTTKDGILKLDTRTGAVSLCSHSSGSWKCQGIDGNNNSLRDQVEQLQNENARLQSQLDAARLSPVPDGSGKVEIPSEEDVDKAMDFMERLLNRFKGMVEDLKKDEKREEGVPL